MLKAAAQCEYIVQCKALKQAMWEKIVSPKRSLEFKRATRAIWGFICLKKCNFCNVELRFYSDMDMLNLK